MSSNRKASPFLMLLPLKFSCLKFEFASCGHRDREIKSGVWIIKIMLQKDATFLYGHSLKHKRAIKEAFRSETKTPPFTTALINKLKEEDEEARVSEKAH